MRFLIPSVALLCLASACSTPESTPEGTPSGPAASRREGRRADGPPDLVGMLTPVPEYVGNGRNLFAFGPPRTASGPTTPVTGSVEPPQLVAPPAIPTPTPRAGPSAPATGRLSVKYAGFLEKTGPDGAKAKYAIFLDGNEILAGAEGETIGSGFTVVEIGLESVTVSARNSSTTQRIPLQSN